METSGRQAAETGRFSNTRGLNIQHSVSVARLGFTRSAKRATPVGLFCFSLYGNKFNMATTGDRQREEDKPIKVDKWDGAALKNALDDAAKKVLVETFGYKESHYLMDGRLGICTIAVAFAMFALLWDYLHPFPASRPVLIVCVVSYFIMMGVLTMYTTFQERGTFLVALDKDKAGIDPDNIWKLDSQLKRYDDMYHLNITYIDGQTKQVRKATFAKSVSNFFEENGYLCHDLVEPEIKQMHASLTSEKKSK